MWCAGLVQDQETESSNIQAGNVAAVGMRYLGFHCSQFASCRLAHETLTIHRRLPTRQ